MNFYKLLLIIYFNNYFNQGYQGFLNKFPEYKGDPIKKTVRIDPKKEGNVFK